MRAYHRVDPLMDERKGHYTPAQLGAFMKVQLVAGRQSRRGWFRSADALRAILPTAYVRHVDFLVTEGDLVPLDGGIYIDGWNEWQEGDLTVSDRMTRLRNRKRNGAVTSTVTPTVTEPSPTAIRSSVGVSVSGAIAPSTREPDRADVEAFLAVRMRLPSSAQQRLMDDYVRTFDLTGPTRAAELILAHPDDPIGALKDDLSSFRRGRAEAAIQEERENPRRQRETGSGMTGVNQEMARLMNPALITGEHNRGAHVDNPNPECRYCREGAA